MAPFDWPYTIFLLIRHCKYSSILHYERDKAIYWLKIAIFSYPCIRRPPRPNIAIRFSTQKLERFGYPIVPRLCIASRGKKWSSDGWWEWAWVAMMTKMGWQVNGCDSAGQRRFTVASWHTIQKPVPENLYRFPSRSRAALTRTRFRYQKKSVSNSMTHLQETGTGFLVPVFGTAFWIVCHGP